MFRDKLTDAIQYLMNSVASGNMKLAKAILTISDQDLSIVNAIYDLILPVAFIALIAYWLEGYLEMASGGREISKDQITQSLTWLIIGIVVMQSINFIVSQFATINNVVLNDFYKAIQDIDLSEAEAEAVNHEGLGGNALETMNVLLLIVALAIAAFTWVINIFSMLVLAVTCMSAKVEIVLRLCLVPIGITPLANSAYKTEAIRYLKKTLAAVFYGGIILVVIYIADTGMATVQENMVAEAAGQEGLIAVFQQAYPSMLNLVAPFAAIGAISTAKSLANEAFGG